MGGHGLGTYTCIDRSENTNAKNDLKKSGFAKRALPRNGSSDKGRSRGIVACDTAQPLVGALSGALLDAETPENIFPSLALLDLLFFILTDRAQIFFERFTALVAEGVGLRLSLQA